MIILGYNSDQGLFLEDHDWFDKRFVYEESFQMPFLVRYPRDIAAGSIFNDIVCNINFAATFLDLAELRQPSYMQGHAFRKILSGATPKNW